MVSFLLLALSWVYLQCERYSNQIHRLIIFVAGMLWRFLEIDVQFDLIWFLLKAPLKFLSNQFEKSCHPHPTFKTSDHNPTYHSAKYLYCKYMMQQKKYNYSIKLVLTQWGQKLHGFTVYNPIKPQGRKSEKPESTSNCIQAASKDFIQST